MDSSCIQPEVILVEGSATEDTSIICSPEGILASNQQMPVKRDTGSLPPMTIPLPHLLNDGGSWQEGSLLAEHVTTNDNGQEQAEGQEFEPAGDERSFPEGERLQESSEINEQRNRPTLRPRVGIQKKRGRKGMPRKAAVTASMSKQHQNAENIAVPAIFEQKPDNEALFQVALEKMTMRTSDERRGVSPYLVHMPPSKRASLSLQDKISVIQELSTGEKQATLCKKRGLPKSTVQSIWKNREKIQGAVEKIGVNRKRCRRAQHEDVEDKLVEWIKSLEDQKVAVNGPQLRAKAQVMAKQMGLTEFRCSTGWLDKFKSRHKIIFKKPKTNPKNNASCDRKAALDWVTKVWPALCEGYLPLDIFNVDEVGIFYKAPPEKSHRLRGETCHGGKMSKDRFTVLLCTNSDGSEKLKLTVVGCVGNPRSFAGIPNLENLPANWHFNSKSWMTRDIFVSWLRNWDELLRSSDRQILLILDSSPCHEVTEQFTNIKLVFLPPVIASILQPMEHGITSGFKLHYRRLLLDRMVRKVELGGSRTISILEALTMCGTAWTEVSTDLITECFRTSNLQSLMVPDLGIGNNLNNDYEMLLANERKLLQQAIRIGIPIPDNVSFKEYALIDSSLHVTDYIQDSSVCPEQGSDVSSPDENHDEEITHPIQVPSLREVQGYIDAIRNWAMIATANCDTGIHMSLSILESYALRAKSPIPVPPNDRIEINVNMTNEQDMPASVVVSSQNGTPNCGVENNMTLASFSGSQQIIQIPIIHSQPTELVTLTTLEPAPPEELDALELDSHGQSPQNNQEADAMHFQHDQHQSQFFAYLQ